MQSHQQPQQALRLLSRLREGSPDAVLVAGHCPTAEALDPVRMDALGVLGFRHARKAHRGYWSLLEPYFMAVELLAERGVAYDWLVYLSGADYPLQPLVRSEAELAGSPFDGYLSWRPMDQPGEDGRRRQGVVRYAYRYVDVPRAARLLPLLRRLNSMQPWFQVHLTYGPRVGRRLRSFPALAGRTVNRGSQWTTLRRACAERVAMTHRNEPDLVRYFAATVCPDEAFAQTVLLGVPGLQLCNDNLRYVKKVEAKDGHPPILRIEDGPALVASGKHFGRKVDPEVDAGLLAFLDARLSESGADVAATAARTG